MQNILHLLELRMNLSIKFVPLANSQRKKRVFKILCSMGKRIKCIKMSEIVSLK